MIIKTNTNIESDKTSYNYCEKYSLFTKQELEDFYKTNGLYTRTGQQWGSKKYYLCIDSKIVYTEAGRTLKFIFIEESPDQYRLNGINGYFYSYSSSTQPFFKDMGLDLYGIFELYKKKYSTLAAKIALRDKQISTERKLNDINTDEIELDFMTMAEKYGFEFSSQHPSTSYYKNNTYLFENKKNNRYIKFKSFAVKSKNIQCWQVCGLWPFVNTSYNTYVGTFDEIKKVAEGYMMMFQDDTITTDYNRYTPQGK
jgi:hypothetical protein